ncbi:unnamed protein product [Clonostachys rosea]|uniref:Uncharacterized protein n=1 Tax=Bionectria ochroleuca TaxID=29856 RepID=A0ABY6TWW1_BIOOC|nr:unnamed protein product [Clonostachys rosea]
MGVTSLSANGAASGVNPAAIVPGLHVSGASLASQGEYDIDPSCYNMWTIIEACQERTEESVLRVNRDCLCDRDIISSWITCHKCWDRITYHSNGKRDLASSPHIIDDVTLSLVQSLCDRTALASVAPDDGDLDSDDHSEEDTDEEESNKSNNEESDEEESNEEESDEDESDDDESDEEESDDDEFDDELFDDEESDEVEFTVKESNEVEFTKHEPGKEDEVEFTIKETNEVEFTKQKPEEEHEAEEDSVEEDVSDEDDDEEDIDEEGDEEEDDDEEDVDEEDANEEGIDEEESDEDQLSATIGTEGVFGSHDCVSSGKKPISGDFDLASGNPIGINFGHSEDESLIINSAGKQSDGFTKIGKTAPDVPSQAVDIFANPARVALGHEYKEKSNANTRITSVGLVVLGLFAAWAM